MISKQVVVILVSSSDLLRKGVPVHIAIIEAYVKGLALKEEDKVIVFDVLPNRLG